MNAISKKLSSWKLIKTTPFPGIPSRPCSNGNSNSIPCIYSRINRVFYVGVMQNAQREGGQACPKTRPIVIKGTVSRDFLLLLVFLWISFPPAPEYPIRPLSNFFKKSWRFLQVKVHHWYQRHRWQFCHRCERHGRQNCRQYQRCWR